MVKPKTVRELIAFLETCDPDSFVTHFVGNKYDPNAYDDTLRVREAPCLVLQREEGTSYTQFYEWEEAIRSPGGKPPKTKMVMFY